MNYIYSYPKEIFPKEEIDVIRIEFKNGDFVYIKKDELIDIEMNIGDNLIWYNGRICLVVSKGFIKFRVKDQYHFTQLYNPSEYDDNPSKYIIDRCLNHDVKEIKIYDQYQWYFTLYSLFSAKFDGEDLIVEFNYPESDINPECSINMHNVTLDDVCSIKLDYENCDEIVIYQEEIEELELNFNPQLKWLADDLGREVVSGYIKLKIDKSNYAREINIGVFDNHNAELKNMETRLYGLWGKKGAIPGHDICHLYIRYHDFDKEECVEVPNLLTDEELVALEEKEEQGYNFKKGEYICYISGYTEKQKDGTIVIYFGKRQ